MIMSAMPIMGIAFMAIGKVVFFWTLSFNLTNLLLRFKPVMHHQNQIRTVKLVLWQKK